MAASLASLIPNAEDALELETEELARVLLVFLAGLPDRDRTLLNLHNFMLPSSWAFEGYPEYRRKDLIIAFTQAWRWLDREGFVTRDPSQSGADWIIVTDQGKRAAQAGGFESYRLASMLPRGSLHPTVADKAWPAFLRGEYDNAVFQAFKQVEVAVRDAGGFQASDYGVNMMRYCQELWNGP